ncbi:MAG TPA: hypothetical protein VM712_09150 [Gaiellales bacterium]|nr:hypothetical protein [Gaiellales bacterium]
MWMFWIMGGLAAWLLVAALVGVTVGRGIRLADERCRDAVLTMADLPNFVAATCEFFRHFRCPRSGSPHDLPITPPCGCGGFWAA